MSEADNFLCLGGFWEFYQNSFECMWELIQIIFYSSLFCFLKGHLQCQIKVARVLDDVWKPSRKPGGGNPMNKKSLPFHIFFRALCHLLNDYSKQVSCLFRVWLHEH